MHISLADLKLDQLAVIYPGSKVFPLTENITAYGLETIVTSEFMQQFDIKV